jgi:hypothetical protein
MRVLVHGDAGDVIGQVVDVCTPDELPLGPGHPTGEFISVLKEMNVSHLAHILYHCGDVDVMFTALAIDGEWYDLHDQHLTLEVVGVHHG